jgi:AcrR family transcriptional regulator
MADECHEIVDPRVRRTRQLLHQSLAKLLETKEFEKISVQDITDAATLNRATFYDHYADKFALLKSMVGARFHELLEQRGVRFDGACTSAIRAIALSVCDYLAAIPGVSCDRQIEPHMESAVIGVVRWMILDGLTKHPAETTVSSEMIATTVSWAIYGAGSEWVRTPNRSPSCQVAETIANLVSPILPLHGRP